MQQQHLECSQTQNLDIIFVQGAKWLPDDWGQGVKAPISQGHRVSGFAGERVHLAILAMACLRRMVFAQVFLPLYHVPWQCTNRIARSRGGGGTYTALGLEINGCNHASDSNQQSRPVHSLRQCFLPGLGCFYHISCLRMPITASADRCV